MSNRYKFFGTPGPKVICVSSYAGKNVRRTATCSENDEYSYEKGCQLAQARVDEEIARRKVRRASECVEKAFCALIEAKRKYTDMCSYHNDAREEHKRAKKYLQDLLDTM